MVQAVSEDGAGVASAVSSIARSVGQALGSTVAVGVTLVGMVAGPGSSLNRYPRAPHGTTAPGEPVRRLPID